MYYINPNIKELKRIFPMSGRSEYLRLDMNENPEGLPEDFVKEVLNDITPNFLASYPETNNLIRKLSRCLNVNEEQICITNGSDMGIRYIFETFAESGSNVVTIFPSFEMYSVYCKMFGLTQKIVDYNSDFTIDTNKIIEAIDINTDIVVLLNPNNPIGNVYSNSDIERIINKAREVGAIVIIDEAYHYFYSDTYLSNINNFENVIILRTFSKLCSIASCRIGFLISDKEIINYIKKSKSTFDVNGVGIKFAEKILESNYLIDELINIEKEGKIFILDRLKEENYEYYSENGNYIFIKTRKKPKYVYEKLKEQKILTKVYSYDILKKYIRITTGSKNAMEKFINEFLIIDKY